jgi:hypothetical protein
MDTNPIFRLRDGLHKHFGPGAAVFVDTLLWLTGHVCVDIVRLDYWLQQRNPDYADNDSMRGFIRRKYGQKAERFVAYWLKGEPRDTRNRVKDCRSDLRPPDGTCGSPDG